MNYWVTYSDKNYMKNTDILLSLLSKFSNIKLIFFISYIEPHLENIMIELLLPYFHNVV